MSTSEICPSGQPSFSSETQDESIWIELIAILIEHEKSPIIHKVPHRLRQVNEKAYEPNIVSIGPYHHGKPHLREMEDIKTSFFIKTVGQSRENLQRAIIAEDERIMKCYVETNGLSSKEFVDMVVLDGFFIVQLFRGFPPIDLLRRSYFVNEIVYDLLLLENQLPFFVLEKIYEIMTQNEVIAVEFTVLVLRFFKNMIGETESSKCPTPKENIKHLLGLIHDTPRWRPSNGTEQEDEMRTDQSKKAKWGWKFIPCGREQEETGKKTNEEIATDPDHINGNEDRSKKAKCGWKFLNCGRELEETGKKAKRGNFIRSARELEEAGISFEMRDEKEDKCRALDIVFKGNWRKAKLRIPKLMVTDHTERMLRNLIAFEQFLPFGEPTYVFDYVNFLDQLINSEKDVQLLCNSDIIENWLGDYETVAQVFNRLGDNTYQSTDFHYSGIFEQVNRHCNNRWNKHMANLHRNYFNSPWALASFLAALLLLFLTFAQTTFTLLTNDRHSCVLLSIVLGVSFVVIGLFSCWRFG